MSVAVLVCGSGEPPEAYPALREALDALHAARRIGVVVVSSDVAGQWGQLWADTQGHAGTGKTAGHRRIPVALDPRLVEEAVYPDRTAIRLAARMAYYRSIGLEPVVVHVGGEDPPTIPGAEVIRVEVPCPTK